MNGWQITLLLLVILVVDGLIIGAVFSLCITTLRPLHAAFPPVAPNADAVWKKWQSFRFDLLNFGNCVHVAADEHHFHLRPSRFARWLGLRDMSIPWGAVTVKRIKGRRGEALVRGTRINAPAWCLKLAGDPVPAKDSTPE